MLPYQLGHSIADPSSRDFVQACGMLAWAHAGRSRLPCYEATGHTAPGCSQYAQANMRAVECPCAVSQCRPLRLHAPSLYSCSRTTEVLRFREGAQLSVVQLLLPQAQAVMQHLQLLLLAAQGRLLRLEPGLDGCPGLGIGTAGPRTGHLLALHRGRLPGALHAGGDPACVGTCSSVPAPMRLLCFLEMPVRIDGPIHPVLAALSAG